MFDSGARTASRDRFGRRLTASVVSAAVLVALVGGIPATAQVATPATPLPETEASPAAAKEGSAQDAMLAYAECMRDHGIEVTNPVFDAAGKMVGGLEFEGGKDAKSGRFLAANEACNEFLDAFEPALKEEQTKADVCDNSSNPDYRSLVQGDETRDYLLHVPDSVTGDTATPLIINFHGFGGCATDFAGLVGGLHGLHDVAEEEGFLVAYPQGLERAKGGAEWDLGDDESEDITTNDLVFTERLVQNISDEHSVDTTRVYATGYSNGGMMAYGLACSRGGLIAAAGIMSGVMLQDDCDQQHPTSIIHFHGAEDGVLPLEGSRGYQAVPSIADFWLEQNSIPRDSLSSDELKGGDVLRESYEGGSQGTSFALYTIRSEYGSGGGHVWFSEEIEGQTPNEILWDFLSEKRRQD